jgi:hypothetical protein
LTPGGISTVHIVLTPGGNSTVHIVLTPGSSSTVHIVLTPGSSSTVHIVLTPGSSSTVHTIKQKHKKHTTYIQCLVGCTVQNNTSIYEHKHTIWRHVSAVAISHPQASHRHVPTKHLKHCDWDFFLSLGREWYYLETGNLATLFKIIH